MHTALGLEINSKIDELSAELSDEIAELSADIKSLRELLAAIPSSSSSGASSRSRALPEAKCRKEDGEFIWDIPDGAPKGKCKHCQLEILWVRSRKGFACPIDPDGKSHRDTCPEREQKEAPSAGSNNSSEINVPF